MPENDAETGTAMPDDTASGPSCNARERPETWAAMPPWFDLLGLRVRVWDGPGLSVRAEGEVIGVIAAPTLVIRQDDGTVAHESSDLPVDWRHEEWRRGR